MQLYLQGVVFAHKKEYYKARAVFVDSVRREERRTGVPMPLAHWHLAQIYAKLKDELPNALTHAQRELDLLTSADPGVVPPQLREKVEAMVTELSQATTTNT